MGYVATSAPPVQMKILVPLGPPAKKMKPEYKMEPFIKINNTQGRINSASAV